MAQSNYERYLERYTRNHNITEEQAKQHCLVNSVKESYDEEEHVKDGGKSI